MTKTKTKRLVFKQVNIFRFEMATIFNNYHRELIFGRLKPAFESSFGEKESFFYTLFYESSALCLIAKYSYKFGGIVS